LAMSSADPAFAPAVPPPAARSRLHQRRRQRAAIGSAAAPAGGQTQTSADGADCGPPGAARRSPIRFPGPPRRARRSETATDPNADGIYA
jgi:hypothetical protein